MKIKCDKLNDINGSLHQGEPRSVASEIWLTLANTSKLISVATGFNLQYML